MFHLGSNKTASAMIERMRKAVLNGALLIWAAALGMRGILETIYFDYQRQPDPATARTIPYVAKNVVVYITQNQAEVLYWLRWSFYALGVLIVICAILNEIFPPRSNKSP
jgi:hypothetical protein